MNTKEKILAAFNELITKGGFESVTVFQIARQAGVSRATFYRHFKDKYDVMNYNYSSLLDRYMKKGRIHTMEDLFYLILNDGKNYWKPLLPLFKSEGVNSFESFICEYSFTSAKNLYEYGNIYADREPIRRLSEAEILQLQIFANGAGRIYKDWIDGKYSLSTKEAAAALAEIIPSSMKGDLFDRTV